MERAALGRTTSRSRCDRHGGRCAMSCPQNKSGWLSYVIAVPVESSNRVRLVGDENGRAFKNLLSAERAADAMAHSSDDQFVLPIDRWGSDGISSGIEKKSVLTPKRVLGEIQRIVRKTTTNRL